ncbi:hypothetical protein JCM6882_001804 [Rhodosporidiobolus microsporus]
MPNTKTYSRKTSSTRGVPIRPQDPTSSAADSSDGEEIISVPAPRAGRASARAPVTKPSTASRSTRASEELDRRSMRSSGKAEFFKPLDGAPTSAKGGARGSKRPAAPPAKKQAPKKRSYLDETDESEDDLALTAAQSKRRAAALAPGPPPKKPKTATPTKKAASHLPSPARSTASRDSSPPPPSSALPADLYASDHDEDEKMAPSAPPARKSATRTKTLPLPSPSSTPEKKRAASSSALGFSPSKPSPLKKTMRRAAAALSESEAEEEEEDEQEEEEEEHDELDLLTPSSTPRKTPNKAPRLASSTTTTTPVSTPSKKRPSSVTPSRSSSRIQRLPASVAEIANAPAELRNRLVGFHMEDEGYGPASERAREEEEESEEEDEDEDENEVERCRREKGKGRAMDVEAAVGEEDDQQEDASMEDDFSLPHPSALFTLPTPPSSPSSPSSSAYLSTPLSLHLTSTLSLLAGARPPRPFLASDAQTTLPAREEGVMAFPCLEGGYDEWERPLRGALEEVVEKGMGNAVMLLGPRGVGKTMLIDRTLSILSYVHGGPSAFATVRLSGLVHTTDRLALRSIAMQLQQQGFGGGDFDIDEGDFSSNSATMTTLLRLLEPSSSTAASSSSSASAANSTSSAKSKPLILVVDEFDLFAQHPRQSFLYCLLDIVQGNRRRGGVAVVGVSSRVDCLSLLEKRVRSRCQSHVLQIMPPSSLSAFTSLGQRLMRADERAWELERGSGPEGKQWAKRWNEEVERFWALKRVKEYMERVWMVHGNVPTELRSVLSHMFYRLDYRLRLQPPSDALSIPRLTVDLLKPLPAPSPRDAVLASLSTVELTALIGCKHLSNSTSDRQSGFNFEMLWEGYVQHARRASATGGALGVGMKTHSKAAMREAFDTLRTHELLLPRSSSSTSSSTSTAGLGGAVTVPSLSYLSPSARDPFRLYRLVPWAKDVDAEVEARGADCPLGLRRWCKNWLD